MMKNFFIGLLFIFIGVNVANAYGQEKAFLYKETLVCGGKIVKDWKGAFDSDCKKVAKRNDSFIVHVHGTFTSGTDLLTLVRVVSPNQVVFNHAVLDKEILLLENLLEQQENSDQMRDVNWSYSYR